MEGRDERTDSLPAGWGIGAALDVGGVSFLRFVVRGLGNRGWFGYIVVFLCNYFKFIFWRIFGFIIMEKRWLA